MPIADKLDVKIKHIQEFLGPWIGDTLCKYETAELLLEGQWHPWKDLPIQLYFGKGEPVSISWSHFDRLWIGNGDSLPFLLEDSTVRWVENAINKINVLLGRKLRSVLVGQGEMTIETQSVEIWTRLILVFDSACLEVFNALDENGYEVHAHVPEGNFICCVPRS